MNAEKACTFWPFDIRLVVDWGKNIIHKMVNDSNRKAANGETINFHILSEHLNFSQMENCNILLQLKMEEKALFTLQRENFYFILLKQIFSLEFILYYRSECIRIANCEWWCMWIKSCKFILLWFYSLLFWNCTLHEFLVWII